MRKDKSKAEQLRRKGKSYKEISRILDIPISTLSDWFKDMPWSIEIRDRLAKIESLAHPEKLKKVISSIKKKYDTLHEKYRKEAIMEFQMLNNSPLFIAGIMLYWGEGNKNPKNSKIELSNSDPGMIRTFYIFLLNSMNIPKEKITISLILYPDLIDSVQKNFWSKTTGIPLAQFKKSVFIQGKGSKRRLAYGVGIIRINGRKYKEKLLKWIELFMFQINSQVIA